MLFLIPLLKICRIIFEDRAWNVGNNPRTAVRDFLKDNENFVIDTDICTNCKFQLHVRDF